MNKLIILTTHSMEEADMLGDRIAIMAQGKLRYVNAVSLCSRGLSNCRLYRCCDRSRRHVQCGGEFPVAEAPIRVGIPRQHQLRSGVSGRSQGERVADLARCVLKQEQEVLGGRVLLNLLMQERNWSLRMRGHWCMDCRTSILTAAPRGSSSICRTRMQPGEYVHSR